MNLDPKSSRNLTFWILGFAICDIALGLGAWSSTGTLQRLLWASLAFLGLMGALASFISPAKSGSASFKRNLGQALVLNFSIGLGPLIAYLGPIQGLGAGLIFLPVGALGFALRASWPFGHSWRSDSNLMSPPRPKVNFDD